MTTLENLETTLLASRKISDFLKNFSPTQWTRILKAAMILGIQELERHQSGGSCGALNTLYAKDVEDIVVKNEEALMRKKLERMAGGDQHTEIIKEKGKVAGKTQGREPEKKKVKEGAAARTGLVKQGQPKQATVGAAQRKEQQRARGVEQKFQSSFKKGALINSMQRSSSVPAELKQKFGAANHGSQQASGPIMVSDLAADASAARPANHAHAGPSGRGQDRRPGARGPGKGAHRNHRLRQSNSESMILERQPKAIAAKLDPRIYPAWWGDDHLASPAGARGASANEQRIDRPQINQQENEPKKSSNDQRPETSLERGIREIQATALNLDRNLHGINRTGDQAKAGEPFQQSGPKLHAFFQSTEPMAAQIGQGFGSSFYPQHPQAARKCPPGPFNQDQELMQQMQIQDDHIIDAREQPGAERGLLNRDLLDDSENRELNGADLDQGKGQRIMLTREDLEGEADGGRSAGGGGPPAQRGSRAQMMENQPTRKGSSKQAKPAHQQNSRPQRSQPRAAPQGSSRTRVQQYQRQLQEQKVAQGKALPSYLRHVQSKERRLISRDRQIATTAKTKCSRTQRVDIQQEQNQLYDQLAFQDLDQYQQYQQQHHQQEQQEPPARDQGHPGPGQPPRTNSKLDNVQIFLPPERKSRQEPSSRSKPAQRQESSRQREEEMRGGAGLQPGPQQIYAGGYPAAQWPQPTTSEGANLRRPRPPRELADQVPAHREQRQDLSSQARSSSDFPSEPFQPNFVMAPEGERPRAGGQPGPQHRQNQMHQEASRDHLPAQAPQHARPHPAGGPEPTGYHSNRGAFNKLSHEQEYFGAAGSPIMMASGEYDATADFADEAMAQRVMEEENLRRQERQKQQQLQLQQRQNQQQQIQYQREQIREEARAAEQVQAPGQENGQDEDEYMRSYVNKAMRIGQKLGLDKLERNDAARGVDDGRRQVAELEGSHHRKETLTLSGTLSGATTNYGVGAGHGQQQHETASSNFGPQNLLSSTDRQQFYLQSAKDQRAATERQQHSQQIQHEQEVIPQMKVRPGSHENGQPQGNTYSRSSDTTSQNMNDDGELSQTSNEEGDQMMKQQNHEVINLRARPDQRGAAQQYQNTSSEITNTEAEGEYEGEEEEADTAQNADQSSSDLSSATESVRNADEGAADQDPRDQRYPDERHRDNPLFRSDAFEQIPSQMHQVMSLRPTAASRGHAQGERAAQDLTNNTDLNIQENFTNESNFKNKLHQGYDAQAQHMNQMRLEPRGDRGRDGRDQVNNTNDLNPMIMMSGEDGSASHSNISAVNLTNLTQGGPGGYQQHGYPSHHQRTDQRTNSRGAPADYQPSASPQALYLNLQNTTTDGGGPNPFATQNMIGLAQMQASSQSQSQSRVYHEAGPADAQAMALAHAQDRQRALALARQRQKGASDYGPGHGPQQQNNEEDFELWTGRNQHQEGDAEKDGHGEASDSYQGLHEQHRDSYREQGPHPSDSPFLDNTNISYFNGQLLPQIGNPAGHGRGIGNPLVNETQDRASIASNPGFPENINDVTGITRGGEVTVVNDPHAFPPVNGSVERFYPSSGASPSPGASGGYAGYGKPGQVREITQTIGRSYDGGPGHGYPRGEGGYRDGELVMQSSEASNYHQEYQPDYAQRDGEQR